MLPKGPTWRRHVDQLRPRWSSSEDNNFGDDFNKIQGQMETDRNSPKDTNSEIATLPTQETQAPENVGSNSYDPENPGRSKRGGRYNCVYAARCGGALSS